MWHRSRMTAPTHLLSGLAGVVLLANAADAAPSVIDILAVVIGVLLPDIEGNGVITRPGKILRQLIGQILADLIDLLAGIIAFALRMTFGHRGFLHSLFVPALIFIVSSELQNTWLGWLAFGYTIHIAGDFFTESGVQLFSPFTKDRFSIPLFRTGSIAELAVAIPLLGFTVVSGWKFLPEPVKQTHAMLFETLSSQASTAYLSGPHQQSRQRTLARKLTSGALAQR